MDNENHCVLPSKATLQVEVRNIGTNDKLKVEMIIKLLFLVKFDVQLSRCIDLTISNDIHDHISLDVMNIVANRH